MTTALYRRYRPETFQEVIGQEHVTEPLMAALRADRVTHAYLFSGPRGCGKTTSARILARCLNCAQGPTDTPCGTCESCVDLARGGTGSLDVVEIDAASHGGVDDARELRERATFAPARDRYKVFIIDEAHMVSTQGFNALLKLVEEPPEHVKFIFATTEPEKVIGTIRSRTHHYPFRLVPPELLEEYLAKLCAEEGVEVGGGVFPLVVRAGGGSVRDTLSVLDQLVAGAIDGQVDYRRAAALLGYTDAALLDGVTDAIGARDGAALFTAVDRVVQSGHDPRRFVEDLLQRLRDLVVLAVAGDAAIHALTGLPQDRLERMRAQSDHIGAWRLSRAADLTNEALSEMSGTTSPRLQLELLCARILLVGEGGGAGSATGSAPGEAGAHAGDGHAGPSDTPGGRPAGAPRLRVPDSRVRPAAQESSGPRADEPAERGDGTGTAQPGRTGTAQPGPADRSQAAAPDRRDAASDAQDGGQGAGSGGPRADGGKGAGRAPEGRAPDAQARGAQARDEQAPGERGRAEQARGERAQARPDGAEEQQAAHSAPGRSQSAGAGDAQLVHERWNEVVAHVRSVYVRSLVGQHARPGELAGGALRVDFTNETLAGHFDGRDGTTELATALFEVLGLQVRVVTGVGGAATPAPAAMGGWSAEPEQRGPSRDERQDRQRPREQQRPDRDERDGGRPAAPRSEQRDRGDSYGRQPGRDERAQDSGASRESAARREPAAPRRDQRAPGEQARGGAARESADDQEGDSGWPTVAVPGSPGGAPAAVGPTAAGPTAGGSTAVGVVGADLAQTHSAASGAAAPAHGDPITDDDSATAQSAPPTPALAHADGPTASGDGGVPAQAPGAGHEPTAPADDAAPGGESTDNGTPAATGTADAGPPAGTEIADQEATGTDPTAAGPTAGTGPGDAGRSTSAHIPAPGPGTAAPTPGDETGTSGAAPAADAAPHGPDDSWVVEPPTDDDAPHDDFTPAPVAGDPEERRLSRRLGATDEGDVRPGGPETGDALSGASGPLEDAESPVTPGVPVHVEHPATPDARDGRHRRPATSAEAAAPQPRKRPWERFATTPGPGSDERARPTASDDDVSMDDVDVEDSGLVGVPVLRELLGGVVLEERATTNDGEVW